jgi:tetratricopeptide (TPR) repeat protein
MTDTHTILGEALEHHQAGRRAEAERLYRQALAADPDEPTALYLYGLLNFESGQVEAALNQLGKVVALRPDHAQARFTLANVQHWRGRYEDAIAGYEAVIKLRADHLAAHVGLAKAQRDQGELDAAAAAARAALDIDPSSAEAHETLGSIFSGQGRGGAAVEAYRLAIRFQPDLASAQIGLALALLSEERPREALGAADTALAIDASLADGWFAQGSALRGLWRLDEAVEAFKQAIAHDPAHTLAHLSLGNVYGELQQGEEAIQHLREAVSLDPSLKEAHASLGSLYLLTGQKKEAEQFSWLALAIDPDMIAPHLNLASILAERHETAKARQHRQAAYGQQNLFIETAPDPVRRVLILSTAEYGNVPFKFLLPRERFTRLRWVVEYAAENQAEHLPPYDLVFNAIGDPDLAPPTQAPVERFQAVNKAPVFNDPAKVRRTQRDEIPKLLEGLPDVIAPKAARISAYQIAREGSDRAIESTVGWKGLSWPVLLRPIGSHGGKGLMRIEDAADAETVVSNDGDLYLTAFHDYRSADGAWRKYRMIFVGGRPYPYHLAISDDWMVHHGTAEMTERPDRLAEELRFLEDPEAAIGAKAMAAVAAIGQRLKLDYCGVDFSVLPDGTVLVFEANATMLVHPEEADSPLAPKNPYVKRILDAFEAMITA